MRINKGMVAKTSLKTHSGSVKMLDLGTEEENAIGLLQESFTDRGFGSIKNICTIYMFCIIKAPECLP